jgi:hypothetical protein
MSMTTPVIENNSEANVLGWLTVVSPMSGKGDFYLDLEADKRPRYKKLAL